VAYRPLVNPISEFGHSEYKYEVTQSTEAYHSSVDALVVPLQGDAPLESPMRTIGMYFVVVPRAQAEASSFPCVTSDRKHAYLACILTFLAKPEEEEEALKPTT
jgi:hypothetical protein